MKLFFKRPPEMQAMLGRLFQALLDGDDLEPDLNDRVLFYYRLLQHSPEKAQAVVLAPRQPISSFTEGQDDSVKERIWREFNSLAIIYGLPAEKFTDDAYLIIDRIGDEDGDEDDEDDYQDDGAGSAQVPGHAPPMDAGAGDPNMISFEGGAQQASAAVPQAAAPQQDDLLGDLLNFGDAAPAQPAATGSSIVLRADAALSQGDFQRFWSDAQATAAQNVASFQVANANLETM